MHLGNLRNTKLVISHYCMHASVSPCAPLRTSAHLCTAPCTTVRVFCCGMGQPRGKTQGKTQGKPPAPALPFLHACQNSAARQNLFHSAASLPVALQRALLALETIVCLASAFSATQLTLEIERKRREVLDNTQNPGKLLYSECDYCSLDRT